MYTFFAIQCFGRLRLGIFQMSWLHMSPSDPTSVAQYIVEIQRLEMELGRANENIGEKFDRLEHQR